MDCPRHIKGKAVFRLPERGAAARDDELNAPILNYFSRPCWRFDEITQNIFTRVLLSANIIPTVPVIDVCALRACVHCVGESYKAQLALDMPTNFMLIIINIGIMEIKRYMHTRRVIT